jgi:hypothetical protein
MSPPQLVGCCLRRFVGVRIVRDERRPPIVIVPQQAEQCGRGHQLRNCTTFACVVLSPVRLMAPVPPGLLRLATSPELIGSPPPPNTIGIVAVAALAAIATPDSPAGGDDRHLTFDQIAGQRRQAIIVPPVRPAIDDYILASNKAAVSETPEERYQGRAGAGRSGSQIANHQRLGLLCTYRAQSHRPNCRAAEPRNEFASPDHQQISAAFDRRKPANTNLPQYHKATRSRLLANTTRP